MSESASESVSELTPKYLRLLRGLVLLVVIQISLAGAAMAKQALVTRIIITENPLSVQFSITGKAPVKVIRIGDNEVLVALKNAALAKGYTIQGKTNPAIQSVNVELLEGNVLAVMVTSKKPYGKIDSGFNKAKTKLTVALGKNTVVVPKPASQSAETLQRSRSSDAAPSADDLGRTQRFLQRKEGCVFSGHCHFGGLPGIECGTDESECGEYNPTGDFMGVEGLDWFLEGIAVHVSGDDVLGVG